MPLFKAFQAKLERVLCKILQEAKLLRKPGWSRQPCWSCPAVVLCPALWEAGAVSSLQLPCEALVPWHKGADLTGAVYGSPKVNMQVEMQCHLHQFVMQ